MRRGQRARRSAAALSRSDSVARDPREIPSVLLVDSYEEFAVRFEAKWGRESERHRVHQRPLAAGGHPGEDAESAAACQGALKRTALRGTWLQRSRKSFRIFRVGA